MLAERLVGILSVISLLGLGILVVKACSQLYIISRPVFIPRKISRWDRWDFNSTAWLLFGWFRRMMLYQHTAFMKI